MVTLEHPQVGDAYRRTTLTVVRDRAGQPLYLFAQCQDVTAAAHRRAGAAAQRAAVPAHGRRRPRVRHLHARHRGARHQLERRRAAHQGLDRRARSSASTSASSTHPSSRRPGTPSTSSSVALREGVYQEEGWRVRKDGSRFWAYVTITKIIDEDGQHIGFAKVTRDHTERMQMLEQRGQYADALAEANARLEQANAELAAAADEQSRFLAVTAHELRSPVGVLSASGRMLGENWERLGRTPSATSCWPGCRAAPPAPAAAGRPAHDVAASGGHRSSSTSRSATCPSVLAPALQRLRVAHPDAVIESELRRPGVRAVVDADRLAQIVDNLVANAVAYGRSPIHVSTREEGTHVESRCATPGPASRPSCAAGCSSGSPPGAAPAPGWGCTSSGSWPGRWAARSPTRPRECVHRPPPEGAGQP